MVDIPLADGVADSYLVLPDGDGPFPAVLLFEDAFGLRPRLFEMAERIAAEKRWAVLAPNILYRGGRCPLVDMTELADPDKRGEVFGRIMPMIHGLTPELLAADTARYLDFLAGLDRVGGPVVVTGYCMGGTNALRAIQAHPDRIAGVATYHAGNLVTDAPDSPHLALGKVTGEAYFAHADQDHAMSAQQIKVFEAALDEAGVRYTSELYEGAPHGFTMTDTAAHHAEGERRHWESLYALLDRVG